MPKFATLIVVAFAILVGGVSTDVAAKRVALVIGNAAYKHVTPLGNPKNDADAVAEVLDELGFEVLKGIDLTHREFGRTVAQFRKKLAGANVALLFYAGHGLQVHGYNYLTPVDAQLEDVDGLEFEAVRLRSVLALMEREPRTNLVFLDACRDNPLARNLARNLGTRSASVGRGFAREETGIGTMIAFATQPGNVALDGDDKHSPFTKALLKHITTPGQDIANLMRRVRLDVINATSSRQVPWNNSSLTAPFIFKTKPKRDDSAERRELAIWTATQEQGGKVDYEDYLKRYPKGRYATLANIRLEEIKWRTTQEAERVRQEKGQKDLERIKRELAERQARIEKAEAERKQWEEAERKRLAEERARIEAESKALAEKAKVSDTVQIAGLTPGNTTQPDDELGKKLDPKELALALQIELKRVGCDPGTLDGIWGGKGRAALARFNRYAKQNLSTSQPTLRVLNALKQRTDRTCPKGLTPSPIVKKKTTKTVKKAVQTKPTPRKPSSKKSTTPYAQGVNSATCHQFAMYDECWAKR